MARLLLLGLLSACDPTIEERPGPRNEGPAGEATIELTSPAEGAGTYSGGVDLAWTVENLTLDAGAIGDEARAGRGHVHVYVNGQLVEETAELEGRVDGLGSGSHTIVVRLAQNDHVELDGSDTVDVEALSPTVSIVSPADGTVLTASSVPLVIAIEDFALSPDMGGADVFGEGHFRVKVDGDLRDWGSDPLTAMATGLPEGGHTIAVELVDNEGRPLDPPVVAEIDVTVPVGTRGVYWDRSAFQTAFDSATLPLSLTTTAFTLWDRDLGRPPAEGEGHLHLFMDGVWLDATAETSRVLQNVTPGEHVFEARLVTNDGFELPVVDRMWVNVAPDRPDVLITYPGADWRMGPDFNLTFDAENFTLDGAAMGGTNAPHQGHAQVFLDGVLYTETATGAVPFTGLLPGTHTVRVQLANNDRTLVEPAVYNEIPVIVE